MKSLSIRGRLFLGFGLLMVPLIVIMVITLFKVNASENSADRLINIGIPSVAALANVDIQIQNAGETALDMTITDNNALLAPRYKQNWMDINENTKVLDELSPKWKNQAVVKGWEEIRSSYPKLKQLQDKLFELNSAETAKLIEKEYRGFRDHMLDLISGPRNSMGKREGGVNAQEAQTIQDNTKELDANLGLVRNLSYALLVIALVLAVGSSLYTSRSITGPLNNAISIAERIAAGERNIDINVNSTDETGKLLGALKVMLDSIRSNEESMRQAEIKAKESYADIVHTTEIYGAYASKIAQGDLRTRLEVKRDDSLGQLGRELNNMTDGLALVARKINESTTTMASMLEQVNATSNQQSTGITEQASSINEITASLEEIDKSSKQTMQKANTLGEAAKQTRERGMAGIQSIERSIEGMRSVREKVQTIAQTILDLSNQTQQVGEITSVVNTLAQQSKMLALNASIEAAKAGEAGKGFAVVAIEVKNLAEQSEQSTAQVQKILEDIRVGAERAVMVTEDGTKGVDAGSKLIEDASEVIHNLNDMIQEAAIASQQIETSIHQESISIEQITTGMNEINQVTTSFVAGTRQTASAVASLTQTAHDLKTTVSVYKL